MPTNVDPRFRVVLPGDKGRQIIRPRENWDQHHARINATRAAARASAAGRRAQRRATQPMNIDPWRKLLNRLGIDFQFSPSPEKEVTDAVGGQDSSD